METPNSNVVVTCPSCKVTNETARPRQLCPFCGNFYAHDASVQSQTSIRRVSSRHDSLPSIVAHRPQGYASVLVHRFGDWNSEVAAIVFQRSSSPTDDVDDDTTILPPVTPGSSGRFVALDSARSSARSNPERRLRLAQSQEDLISIKNGACLYPPSRLNRELFCELVATYNEDPVPLHKLLVDVFSSFENICAAFKNDPAQDGARHDTPELKDELLHLVLDSTTQLGSKAHKVILKGIIATMMQEHPRLYSKDEPRVLFILLILPIWGVQSTFGILAHILRRVTTLSNGDHQLMVGWLKTLTPERFRQLLSYMLQFITVRQFPPADHSLPPLSKSRWWVPAATKVIALLNVANNTKQPSLVHYTEFYNHSLDHLDLMQEYAAWQIPDRPDRFSFCQYPFILSVVAKRHILTKDSEQQMIQTARQSLMKKVARNQIPDIDIFFLNIQVRRSKLVEDSLKEIARKQRDLKKKLKVTFEGEPGLDMGGLTKEWFQLLIRQIFEANRGMFVYHGESRSHWFSMKQTGSLREYNMIGVLMGLAVYNSIILDIHFPHICYRKLLSPPVVPNMDYIPVGLIRDISINDLKQIMPSVARSLQEILDYDGNVEEDLCMNFEITAEEFGTAQSFPLIKGGSDVPVTNENRKEFVRLYVEFILNKAIYDQFRAFYLGFHSVCASNALIMLRPEEVETLVCGSPNLDLSELRKVTDYDGYTAEDVNVKNFWDILLSLSDDLQKKFLLFTTGSDRIPVGGMSEMSFKLTAQRDHLEALPQAHTCFNQLVLPAYGDADVMRQKLIIAISNAEGFGLE